MIRQSFAAVVAALLFTLTGCFSPAESTDYAPEPGPIEQALPPGTVPPCGYATDYLNVPMTLNDGSGTYVPFAGTVPAGSAATIPIRVPAGGTLTSITVRIDPATHTSLNGEALPYLELHRVGNNATVTTVAPIVWDPYYNGSSWNPSTTAAAGFSAPHDITMSLNVVVDDAYYFLTFAQEWGGGQAQAGVVCGTKMVYSPSGV